MTVLSTPKRQRIYWMIQSHQRHVCSFAITVIPPSTWDIDPLEWKISIEGEACERPAVITLGELQKRYKQHTLQLQIECAGNGRSEFNPPAKGNQWTTGAIGCPEWTGVRLRDILEDCGVSDNAVYVAYEAADLHLSGDPTKRPISRGVPVQKALEKESMIVWAMNGEPLPELHGFPVPYAMCRLARVC